MQGFIHGGSWSHISTLPVECRPYKRLIFNLNNHQSTSRVDVLPDRRVFGLVVEDLMAGFRSPESGLRLLHLHHHLFLSSMRGRSYRLMNLTLILESVTIFAVLLRVSVTQFKLI